MPDDVKRKPDNAEAIARQAYEIFRGMKQTEPLDPHWDELSGQDKARFEWMVRFACFDRLT